MRWSLLLIVRAGLGRQWLASNDRIARVAAVALLRAGSDAAPAPASILRCAHSLSFQVPCIVLYASGLCLVNSHSTCIVLCAFWLCLLINSHSTCILLCDSWLCLMHSHSTCIVHSASWLCLMHSHSTNRASCYVLLGCALCSRCPSYALSSRCRG